MRAILHELSPPAWTDEPEERFIDLPWVLPEPELDDMRQDALWYAPAAFIRHGVLPDPRDLLFGIGGSLGRVVTLRLADSGDAGRLDARFGAAHDVAGRPSRCAIPDRDRRVEAAPATRFEGSARARWFGISTARRSPIPSRDGYARRGYEAPVGETEVTLAELWSEVLGVERVGRRDHFFELGGHSLLAVRLIETDAPARPLRRRPGAAHRAHAGRNGGDGER